MLNATSAISDNIADFNSVSAIKIDVEGYEINVLNGLEKFFKSVNILPLLTIEMLNKASNPEITSILIDFGSRTSMLTSVLHLEHRLVFVLICSNCLLMR